VVQLHVAGLWSISTAIRAREKFFSFHLRKTAKEKKIRRLIRLLKNILFFDVNRGKLGVSWLCGSTDLHKYGS